MTPQDPQELAQALQAASRNYQTLYEAIPIPAFVYDLSTRSFTNANPAAAALLGLSAEKLVGMSLIDFIPQELREAFIADLKRRDPRAYTHDYQRIQDHAGRLLDVEVHARYIELDEKPLRLVMMIDISAQVEAREALRKNEARYRALLEDSSEAMVLMSPDGRVLFASRSMENVTGYAPEERVGTLSNGFLHPEDRDGVWAVFKQALNDPSRTYTFESRFLHKQGHYIRTAAKLRNFLDDPAVGALVLNYRDVSAEHEAQRQLMRFERLAAVGQTAAGLAHEIRNPLATIMARAEYLKMKLPGQGELQPDLDSILRQGERLKTLVSELFDRAQGADLALSDVPAQAVLLKALRSAQTLFGPDSAKILIAEEFVQPAPLLQADEPQLERALANVILNALQASPPKACVTLCTRIDRPWAVLEVSDEGPGIPAARLPKAFDPFFTTKDTGSGLGLWISKNIVELHGGHIEASNLPGHGCRLSLRLPLAGEAKP